MLTNRITADSSARICAHMNDDHKEAVLAYAHHYGGVKKAVQATMVEITSSAMALEVDGKLVQIPFATTIKDDKEAHRTLVSMLRSIQENNLST